MGVGEEEARAWARSIIGQDGVAGVGGRKVGGCGRCDTKKRTQRKARGGGRGTRREEAKRGSNEANGKASAKVKDRVKSGSVLMLQFSERAFSAFAVVSFKLGFHFILSFLYFDCFL